VPVYAQGVKKVIDIGFYDANLMQAQIPMVGENAWENGSYSSSLINKNYTYFDARGLWISSYLNIRPIVGSVMPLNPANITGNKISYSNAVTSISYETLDTSLKETIILTRAASISWQMNFSSIGKVAVSVKDFTLSDPKNYTDWRVKINPPIATGANGRVNPQSFTYVPATKILTLVQNFTGLTFPITIDPSYTVDSSGDVGEQAELKINQTGYPWIIYWDNTNNRMKAASNNSGTWTTATASTATTNTAKKVQSGFDFDNNDLPIILYRKATSNYANVSYFNNGWFPEYNNNMSYGTSRPYHSGVLYNKTSKILYTISNANGVGFNASSTSLASGSPSTFTLLGRIDTSNLLSSASDMNKSGVINYFGFSNTGHLRFNTLSGASTFGTAIDLSLLVDSDYTLAASHQSNDLPMVVYDDNKEQLNLTYQTSTGWKTQTITSNTSPMQGMSIAVNSSGTVYIPFRDAGFLSLAMGTPEGSWNNRTIDSTTSPDLATWTSIAIDGADGLHIAYYDVTNGNLMYYYEPLATAGGGAAPVASFTATPEAGVRNSTRAIVDQSSNTPTSIQLYGAGTNPCIGNNVSFSPGGVVNIFPLNFSWCGVCEIASNAQGSDTICTRLYVSQPWVVW
jgi:hypothetical protein